MIIKLSDYIKLMQPKTSIDEKLKILEKYSFVEKMRLNTRNIQKKHRTRWWIIKRLQQLTRDSKIK